MRVDIIHASLCFTVSLVFSFIVAAKLKDLGNSILGNFGMSVDNFKAVKDPATGSYSISYQS